MIYEYRQPYPNELMHYGIEGMKWGIRRFQNEDGSWTTAGRERYGGKSRKEYTDRMKAEYQKQGYSKFKSSLLAKATREQNDMNTRTYNRSAKKIDKYEDKARKAIQANDIEKAEKFTNKATKAYQDLLINDELIKREMEVGKAFYAMKKGHFAFGIAGNLIEMNKPGGYMDIYNQAKAKATNTIIESKMEKAEKTRKLLSEQAKKEAKAESSFRSSVVKNAEAAAEKYLSGFGEHVGKLIDSDPKNGTLTFLTDNGIATVELDKNGKPLRVGYDD